MMITTNSHRETTGGGDDDTFSSSGKVMSDPCGRSCCTLSDGKRNDNNTGGGRRLALLAPLLAAVPFLERNYLGLGCLSGTRGSWTARAGAAARRDLPNRCCFGADAAVLDNAKSVAAFVAISEIPKVEL